MSSYLAMYNKIKDSDEYLEFDRVENKLSQRPDLHAFILLDRLFPSSEDIIASAEHDEIYLSVDIEDPNDLITPDIVLELYRCGVTYDKGFNCLVMNV